MQGQNLVMQIRAAARAMAPAALTLERQAPAAAAPAPKVSVTGGLDVPSLYMFRGYRQEGDPALTMQPYVNVAVVASDTTKVNFGSWNSFHTGSNKDATGAFYESDFYASAAFTSGKFSPTVLYTAYMSPTDAFDTIHEIALVLGYAHKLAPSVTVAVELQGDHHSYFEAGIAPTLSKADSKVTVTLPTKVGLSLNDYYDGTFGYFSVGPAIVAPLKNGFDIHGSLLVYALGDGPKAVNDGSSQVVGTVGLGFSF